MIILMTGKDIWSTYAETISKYFFNDNLIVYRGKLGMPLPSDLSSIQYNMIISFMSPWIVPVWALQKSSININFHPGSCEYPGIGSYNFALLEKATEFGAVCHHMDKMVDSGQIILERIFDVRKCENVESLKLRTMVTMLSMFHDVATILYKKQDLPVSDSKWTRKPFTKQDLDAVRRIDKGMTAEQIELRIKSLTYPGSPSTYVEHGGVRFWSPVPDRLPLA